MTDLTTDSDDTVRGLRKEGASALAELFSQHRERLWRVAHFRLAPQLRGRIDEDDVLQESYLLCEKRLEDYLRRVPMSPFLWMRLNVLQTLTELHRYHLGVEKRNPEREQFTLSGPGSLETSVSIAAMLAGTVTSPSHAAIRRELSERLESAISEMAPLDQEILALRHFEELTNSEVSQVLGIEQKAASIRYVRALQRLKTTLMNFPEFQEEHSDEMAE